MDFFPKTVVFFTASIQNRLTLIYVPEFRRFGVEDVKDSFVVYLFLLSATIQSQTKLLYLSLTFSLNSQL